MVMTDYRAQLKSFMGEWDWQWFCTFNLRDGASIIYADAFLKQWARDLCKAEHLQIAYQGVLTFDPHPHIHLVALGKNAMFKSLMTADEKRWEYEAAKRTHHSAVIQVIDDDGALNYLIDQNTPARRFELISPYNRDLLEKMRGKKRNVPARKV